MLKLQPVSMFCCGCSVRFGVGLILFLHFAVCVFYVASACSNLIFRSPFFSSSWSPIAQLFYTAFSLVGIPTIAVAFWGMVMRTEVNLRIYFYYLLCFFLIDTLGLLYLCFLEDPCSTASYLLNAFVPESHSSPEAFMCGAFRIASYFVIAAAVSIQVYCLYVVWSMCEDVHSGKNGPELHELIPGKDEIIKRVHRPRGGPQAGVVGFAHSSVPGPYPSPYGTISTKGMPGQDTIFGGTEHETDFPPRRDCNY